jgi:hypothetical protein
LTVLAVLGAVTGSCLAGVSERAEKLAKQFREKYTLHVQTIALSEPKDGKRTLVISEPPPHVTLKDLEGLDPEVFKNAIVRQHSIGSGGFVKDIVAEVPVKPYSAGRLAEFLAQLGTLLYHTPYKLPVVDLDRPAGSATGEEVKLNLQVSTAELRHWLLREEKPLPLYPLGGQRSITASQVFKAAPKTSFVATTTAPRPAGVKAEPSEATSEPGLVVWWVPTGKELDAWWAEARQFTLEADLLLGALTDSQKGLLFVGRARQTTFDRLPPLRVETLLMLSKVKEPSLAQSYERRHPLVYGVSDGHDWAPAYLSGELVDTEFGSLLNVADQLLKRWSNNGEVDYKEFTYNDPKWDFDEPLLVSFLIKKKAKQLTFNWNTKGVGYSVQGSREDPADVFALTRTGSLPVSYIPDSIPQEDRALVLPYEEVGHNFFAKQGDPNLVRVAQYTGFYQIFHQASFHRFASALPTQLDYPETIKRELIQSYLAEIRKAEASDLTVSIEKLIDNAIAYIRAKKLPADREQPLIDSLSRQKTQAGAAAERAKSSLKDATDNERDRLAKYLSNPREAGRLSADDVKLFAAVRPVTQAVALAHALPDEWTKQAKQRALQSGTWIHTPVVVFSRTKGELVTVQGGHNVDAAITRVRVEYDPSVGKDQIKFERGEGGVLILKVSDRDLRVPNEVIRLLGRGVTDQGQLDSVYGKVDKRFRSPKEALEGGGSGNGGNGGGNGGTGWGGVGGFKDDGKPRGWWEHVAGPPPDDVREYRKQRDQKGGVTIYASRDQTTGVITLWKVDPANGAEARRFSATSPLDAADAITASLKADLLYAAVESKESGRPDEVHLIFQGGFTREEADGLARASRRRLGEMSDGRVESLLRAEWYKSPKEALRLAKALRAPVDLKSITISEPGLIEEQGGQLVTSFKVSGRATVEGKPTRYIANAEVKSRGSMDRGKFKAFVEGVVTRLRTWTGTLKEGQNIQDVLYSLDDELRALEKKGDASLRLEDVEVEATQFGIVLHIRVSAEPRHAG